MSLAADDAWVLTDPTGFQWILRPGDEVKYLGEGHGRLTYVQLTAAAAGFGMESHTVVAPPVGTYVRPLAGAQADGVVTGEGWVWGVGELGGEPLVQTVVLVAREPRLGSIPVRDVDPQSLGPVNRAQVRKVCRALHRFLGEGGGKTRGGDFTPYEAAVALALRPLEDVIL